MRSLRHPILASTLVTFTGVVSLPAQVGGSGLPATPPTQRALGTTVAPLSAVATPGDRPGARAHGARVNCDDGLLAVHAENSSLNGILRGIARCTGMQITGTVADQRVFGDYGPAAPSTVLATLLDGTGSNMLLRETAANQPAQLILTPRTGEATPPSSFAAGEDDEADIGDRSGNAQPTSVRARSGAYSSAPAGFGSPTSTGQIQPAAGQAQQVAAPGQTPVPLPLRGSAVTTPASIPLPTTNVNGSPLNTSPTAGSYPTTNSFPIETLPTPSTTPSTSGIVDAPNPPPAGSDTAALLKGVNTNNPGTTNISPEATSTTTTPGGTNTTLPAPAAGTNTNTPAANGTALTPEQIYQQLQQLRQPTTQPSQTAPSSQTPQP